MSLQAGFRGSEKLCGRFISHEGQDSGATKRGL